MRPRDPAGGSGARWSETDSLRAVAIALEGAGRATRGMGTDVVQIGTHLPASSALIAPVTAGAVATQLGVVAAGPRGLTAVGLRMTLIAKGLRYAAWAYDDAELTITTRLGPVSVPVPLTILLGADPTPTGAPIPLGLASTQLLRLSAMGGYSPAATAPQPPDPSRVNAWWTGLPPATRQRLLAEQPRYYGDLGGIPAADRDTANRITLHQDLAAGERLFRDRGLTPPTRSSDVAALTTATRRQIGYYDGPLVVMQDERVRGQLQRYQTALATRETLATPLTLATGPAEPRAATSPATRLAGSRRATPSGGGSPATGQAGARKPPTPLLLTYDSAKWDNKGRVAIAYGDPDKAANVAYSVPGLESRGSKIGQVGGDASRLWAQAQRARPGTTATIAWQGYDAPEFSNVASQHSARAGAALLARDVASLSASNHQAPNVTVIGHSYGSTTTGIALQHEGLADHVNQVILIGSPGVGAAARTVADLHLRRNQVYVGSASRDPVTTYYQGLGRDPAQADFGATRFKAESIHRNSSRSPFALDDHSRYYDATTGSESLSAMTDIVTGDRDQLGAHDLLATPRQRGPGGIPPVHGVTDVIDPEGARTPTGGHQR